jgi:flagellar biogenesis protein FliO
LYIFQVFGLLLLIIAGAYLVTRYGLRSLYPKLSRGFLTVLERVPLDHKSGSALLLVKAGEELMLIGVSQNGVSLLKELPPESMPDTQPDEAAGRTHAGISFARIMEGVKRGRFTPPPEEGGRE